MTKQRPIWNPTNPNRLSLTKALPPQVITQPNQSEPPVPSLSHPNHNTQLPSPIYPSNMSLSAPVMPTNAGEPMSGAAPSRVSATDDAESAKQLAHQPIKILFVGNSQFRHLNTSKMYRDQECKVHVLHKHNLEGVHCFFENYKPETIPSAICPQIISNSMENCMDANVILNKIVTLITTINRNCPGTHIFIGLPLPRLCATSDLTAKYEICCDQVEEHMKNLAAKRHNIAAVWSQELASYTSELFSDNKH